MTFQTFTVIKRLNRSGGNGDAYLASSLRLVMCMSSCVVKLNTLTNSFFSFSFFSVQWSSGWCRLTSC
jgi:hypothetical protein